MIPMCSNSRSPRPFTAGIPPILQRGSGSAKHGRPGPQIWDFLPEGPRVQAEQTQHTSMRASTQHPGHSHCLAHPKLLITPHWPPRGPVQLLIPLDATAAQSPTAGDEAPPVGSPGPRGAPRRPYKSRDSLRGAASQGLCSPFCLYR